MKLDVNCMRYLEKDDFRVLTAIELGMRNHELVPIELIVSIAKLRHGGSHKILSTLLRHKLIAHAAKDYNGYRLSYLGYDILALRTLLSRGIIISVGSQIGVGKESDIFEAQTPDGDEIVLKIHRLGRTSFRAVRRHRDYLENKSKASWLYMSRLAATKEFAFMKVLHQHGFPTPVPIDSSRHIVAMSKVSGFPMAQIKTGKMEGAEQIFKTCLSILRRLAESGLVHCDFNEFNLMVDDDGNVTIIDFPQMVSTTHINARELFDRDINGLIKFFAMKMRYFPPEEMHLKLDDICASDMRLDEKVRNDEISAQDNDALHEYFRGSSATQVLSAESEDLEGGDSGCCLFEGDEKPVEVVSVGIATDESPISLGVSLITDMIESSSITGSGPLAQHDEKEEQSGLPCDSTATKAVNSSAPESGDEVADTGSEQEDDYGDGVVSAGSSERSTREAVRNRIKRQTHSWQKNTSSRNSTKKRNKYGKIDRGDRVGSSMGW